MDKLDKAVVLYFPARFIGVAKGSHCGACWKFVGEPGGEGQCVEVDGDINGPKGTCGLYMHGKPFETMPKFGPLLKITKQIAGYIEQGPTHCGSCEYYGGAQEEKGPCARVQGIVEFEGCSNAWEHDD